MTAADTDRSLQLVLEQGHGTPIWTAARQQGGSGRTCALASLLDTELAQPRLTGGGRQRNRANDLQRHLNNTTDVSYSFRLWITSWATCKSVSQTTTVQLLPVDNHSCIRQPVCIQCSATGGGNVSGVHRRQLRAEFELWKQRWHAAAQGRGSHGAKAAVAHTKFRPMAPR